MEVGPPGDQDTLDSFSALMYLVVIKRDGTGMVKPSGGLSLPKSRGRNTESTSSSFASGADALFHAKKGGKQDSDSDSLNWMRRSCSNGTCGTLASLCVST